MTGVRRAVLRHVAATAGLTVLVAGVVVFGVWRYADGESARSAEQVARQVTSAALVPIASHDFVEPQPGWRADLLARVEPFLASGMVARIKVFAVEDGVATVVFSDEQRAEGSAGRFDEELAAQLAAGEVAVRPAPRDDAHRFENDLPGERMEVFFSFADAGGNPTVMELYVPIDVGGTTAHAVAILLPLVVGGLVVLAAATLPLSILLSRRMERDRAEKQAAERYGMEAAALARRELAHRLHDDVIPDLAGAGLLLESVAIGGHGEQVERVRALVDNDVHLLRSMLDDLAPPSAAVLNLGEDLRALVGRSTVPGRPLVVVDAPDALLVRSRVGLTLERAVVELVRNATTHADAARIDVVVGQRDDEVCIVVRDDGHGFDPATARTPGHAGLRLVERAIEDLGGSFALSAGASGTTITLSVPLGRPASG